MIGRLFKTLWRYLGVLMSLSMLVACGNPASSATPVLPRATVLTGEMSGELRISGSCALVKEKDGPTVYALVWPAYWQVAVTEDQVVAHLPNTDPMTVVQGENVYVGGGQILARAWLSEADQAQIAPDCREPFWLVGGKFERRP